jgi:hypothetical protein
MGSWLQAEGTVTTVQNATTRPMATRRNIAAEPVDVNKIDFTRASFRNNLVNRCTG